MKRLHWVLLAMLLPGLALAVEKGSTLEPWTLQDQFEKAHSLDDSTRVLLVARDMGCSKLVKAALAERPKGYLEARHALFLADISRMPALISRLFAVPAMRDYSYPVLLDRDAAIASRYASDEGKVLWVRLEQRRVLETRQLDSPVACASPWNNCSRDRCRVAVGGKPGTGLGHLCAGAAARRLARAWVELVSDTRRQHLVFGTMLGLFLLWLVRRDFESGLSFHFIGMTAVTLLLDWPLAIVVGLVAQLGLCLLGRQDWLAIGVNGVLLVAIPALIAELAALFVEKRQPRNLFVYIFCCGFFPAALTAVVVLLLGLGVVWIDGLFPMPPWLEDFAGYLWLIMFPEAFINGTVITGLVVYYPEWLETFNRTRYLQAPWKDEERKP